MTLITGAVLKKIAPSLLLSRAEAMAGLIDTICPKYGINSKDVLEEFLATVLHESGEFSIKTENMNYKTAQRLIDVWPSRFNLTGTRGKLDARAYTQQPQRLANAVYNGRMGNQPGSNDGFEFRGGGFIQLTGRDAYQRYAAYKGLGIGAAAINVRSTDEGALDSACWEFAIDKKLIGAAEQDQFQYITKRINGGLVGWNSRQQYYARCKEYLVSL